MLSAPSLHHPCEAGDSDHSQVTGKEREAQNNKVSHPRSPNYYMSEMGFRLSQSGSRACGLTPPHHSASGKVWVGLLEPQSRSDYIPGHSAELPL